jgi:amidase
VGGALLSGVVGSRPRPAHAAAIVSPTPERPLDFRPFSDSLAQFTPTARSRLDLFVLEATAPQFQSDLDAGRYSAVELVTYYVDRIRRLDAGHLRSVMELNPEALEIAAARDGERSQGTMRGPLHGLPVLLKDNIGTGDRLRTTAGAAALSSARCDRDAFLVAALREAGAIILGKTNMSEWAYWMSYIAPSGYSAVGGQVVCPYGPGIDPFGSSTGSAVAASANLAAITVGTETAGSIISPSARASVVGMRPTLGLVSRDRVVPISDECDTAGPIGRSVTDVATLLTAITSRRDIRDRQSRRATGLHGIDFTAALSGDALYGKRIGLIGISAPAASSDDWIIANSGLSDAVRAMQTAGARVAVLRPAPFDFEGAGFVPEFNWGLRQGVDAYLANSQAPVRSLADVVAFNDENPARYAPWGQDRLRDCLGCPLGEGDVRAIARDNREQARAYLTALLDDNDLDAIAGIDSLQSLIYPFAGFPAIAVPAGLSPWGVPFAVTFIGRARADAELLGIAYAYEEASRFRVPPDLPRGSIPAIPPTRVSRARWSPGLAPARS